MRAGMPSTRGAHGLARLVRDWRPQLVQGWLYHGNLAASFSASLVRPRPRVLWKIVHTPLPGAANSFRTTCAIRIGIPLSRATDALIYNAHASRAFHAALGYADNQARVIHNGVDTARFRPDAVARAQVRAELGIDPDTPLIGSIGRLHPVKGQDVFVAAAGILSERHPDARFLLVGADLLPGNPMLESWIESAGIQGRVQLLGERGDVSRLLAALDIATLPSRSEGFPNVVAEAMATGISVVASDVGDTRVLVGTTGTIVPVEDAAALAAAWAELLAAGPEYRRRRGEAARQRIEERFSAMIEAQRYRQLYEKLLHRT
jgi:glycosyltransferase involved in cell wall biosynthesis